MVFRKLFKRSPQPDTEAERRAHLRLHGRVTEGMIIDITADDDGTTQLVHYTYQHGGVDYESSQTLDEDQQSRASDYIPGSHVAIRYDPRQPANSVVV